MIYVAAAETVKWYVAAAIFGAAGFADALIQGASFGDALRAGIIAGVSAGAFSGIGTYLGNTANGFTGQFAAGLSKAGFAMKVGLHAITGGVMSVLQGGKFGHGFAAAGFTALGSSFNNSQFIGGKGFSSTRVVIGAVIGGTASKISGGKFANGAVTGAFSQALKNELTENRKAKWNDLVDEFKKSITEAYELGENFDYDSYIKKIEGGGDWDYKNRPEYKNLPGVEEFGNFAFGATAQAWADGATRGLSTSFPNLSINMSMRGGGWYQQNRQSQLYRPSDGTYTDTTPYPGSTNYGDNWRDGAHIWMGGKYYFRNREQLVGSQ